MNGVLVILCQGRLHSWENLTKVCGRQITRRSIKNSAKIDGTTVAEAFPLVFGLGWALSSLFFPPKKVDGPSPPLTRPIITSKSKQKQSMRIRQYSIYPATFFLQLNLKKKNFLSSTPDTEQNQTGPFKDNELKAQFWLGSFAKLRPAHLASEPGIIRH